MNKIIAIYEVDLGKGGGGNGTGDADGSAGAGADEEGLTEKVIVEQRLERDEGLSHMHTWAKNFL